MSEEKPSKKSSIDSRRSPRRVFKRVIGFLCAGHYELAQALQISEGGMAFVTETEMSIGTRITITFVVPGSLGLVLFATVINDRAPQEGKRTYGVEFQTLDLHQRRIIRGYVSAKTQAEAEAEVA